MSSISHYFARLVLAAFVLGSVVAPALAQAIDPSLSLPEKQFPLLAEALDSALQQSPQMLSKSLDLNRAEAAQLAAHAFKYPTVYGGVRYGVENVSTSGSPSSMGQGIFYSLNATQPLYRWGEIKANVELGDISLKMVQRHYAEAYRDLAGQVRRQFLSLIQMKRSLRNKESLFEYAQFAYGRDKERVKTGELPTKTIVSIQFSYEESCLTIERDREEYASAKRFFMRLTGLKQLPEDRIPLDIPKPEILENQSLKLVAYFDQSEGAKKLPAALSLLDQLRQTELRYKIASVRMRPKVDLYASSSLENQSYLSATGVSQSATSRQSIGISANWSIFDGFATRAAKMSALADKRQAEQDLKTYTEGLDDQKRNALRSFEVTCKILDLAERRLVLAQEAADNAELEAKAGRFSSAQVAGAMNELEASRQGVMANRSAAFNSWSDLVALLGMDPALDKLPSKYRSHGK